MRTLGAQVASTGGRRASHQSIAAADASSASLFTPTRAGTAADGMILLFGFTPPNTPFPRHRRVARLISMIGRPVPPPLLSLLPANSARRRATRRICWISAARRQVVSRPAHARSERCFGFIFFYLHAMRAARNLTPPCFPSTHISSGHRAISAAARYFARWHLSSARYSTTRHAALREELSILFRCISSAIILI